MNNQQNKKKQGTPWLGAVIVLVLVLIRALTDSDMPPAAGAVIVGVILIVIIAVVVSGGAKKKAASKPAPGSARQTPTVELHRPAPSMQRREPTVGTVSHSHGRTANQRFPQPEAYCVTCENTGEDHFVRDRNRRIAQLDEWLKNGLIDREEYSVLKYRFERDQ